MEIKVNGRKLGGKGGKMGANRRKLKEIRGNGRKLEEIGGNWRKSEEWKDWKEWTDSRSGLDD